MHLQFHGTAYASLSEKLARKQGVTQGRLRQTKEKQKRIKQKSLFSIVTQLSAFKVTPE